MALNILVHEARGVVKLDTRYLDGQIRELNRIIAAAFKVGNLLKRYGRGGSVRSIPGKMGHCEIVADVDDGTCYRVDTEERYVWKDDRIVGKYAEGDYDGIEKILDKELANDKV